MIPHFLNNDYVITSLAMTFKKNDVVIIRTNNNDSIIKRINKISDGNFELSSDNKAYESSVCDKIYKKEDILGKVIFKLPI